jgi:3-methyladenine DNA glycosylase/8-oxoguanine DNA glycosylase
MVSKEFYNGEPVTRKDVETVFAPWGEWQGLAYFLWDRSD